MKVTSYLVVKVTLAVPWLSVQEQEGLFPDKLTFNRPDEQECHIRKVQWKAVCGLPHLCTAWWMSILLWLAVGT